jgi:hypothetical protein
MAIGYFLLVLLVLLMAIGTYFICGYYYLMVILLIVIGGYFINGHY